MSSSHCTCVFLHETLSVRTAGKGTVEVTDAVNEALRASGLTRGTVTVFCCHTSCSLVLMENADLSARQDLEAFMERLVPEDEPYFVHTMEGADDMPSHIKMALTRSAEVIPFDQGRLSLGTWQGLFLWEHRARPHSRQIVVSIHGVAERSKSDRNGV
jgi:secondary thiamine-phosphate synthase enzyme